MKTYIINGVSVEFDETLRYADYYLYNGTGCLVELLWDRMLEALSRGVLKWDEETSQYTRECSRWVNEAPRKRHYRQMILDGFNVLCTENFFDKETNGDEIIDWLENCGKIAAKVCRAYGVEPMRPLNHPDPTQPIKQPFEAWETK